MTISMNNIMLWDQIQYEAKVMENNHRMDQVD